MSTTNHPKKLKEHAPKQGHIVILTGERGSGKTTTCRQLAETLRQRGLDCAGIVCPARFESTHKVGIDLLNLQSGECRPLAEIDDQPAALRIGAYRFNEEVIDWGKSCLDAACPCDALIIDEIGSLELEQGQGWVNVLDVLHIRQFDLAVVVVRPILVDTFWTTLGDVKLPVFTPPLSCDHLMAFFDSVGE